MPEIGGAYQSPRLIFVSCEVFLLQVRPTENSDGEFDVGVYIRAALNERVFALDREFGIRRPR